MNKKIKKETINILKKDKNILFAYIFGSIAKKRGKSSDLDIAIYLDKEVKGLPEPHKKQEEP